jgi:hypothetical protein
MSPEPTMSALSILPYVISGIIGMALDARGRLSPNESWTLGAVAGLVSSFIMCMELGAITL